MVGLLYTDKDLAMKVSMFFWKKNGLNEVADNPKKLDDATISKNITKKINPGTAGLDERKTFYENLKKVL